MKQWWQSKILWLQIFAVISLVVPQSQVWIAAHLSEAGGVFAAANFFLRLFYTDKAIE